LLFRHCGHFWPGPGIPHDRVLRDVVVRGERVLGRAAASGFMPNQFRLSSHF
jgi:hypothetical protein